LANLTAFPAYQAQSWTQNPAYLNMTTQGVQIFTIPTTGTYNLTIAGARGGQYQPGLGAGKGAQLIVTTTFTIGDKVSIVVGQQGGYQHLAAGSTEFYWGGGGGGSFFFAASGSLIAAAGGGGGPWGIDCTRANFGNDASLNSSGSSVCFVSSQKVQCQMCMPRPYGGFKSLVPVHCKRHPQLREMSLHCEIRLTSVMDTLWTSWQATPLSLLRFDTCA
jgi:hypothetical protein